ncbi:MAG: hypothetical protein JWM97_1759, partial [Phycisphaerales bacterium]|nr:hypothetical protein [Phycisphaerales bacterium]
GDQPDATNAPASAYSVRAVGEFGRIADASFVASTE